MHTERAAIETARIEAEVTAGQRMTGAEETDADLTLGRLVLTGELSADETTPSGWTRSTTLMASHADETNGPT